MNGTTDHILWVEPSADEYVRDLGECQECGSMRTFVTFDKKLVCRNCWNVEGLES